MTVKAIRIQNRINSTPEKDREVRLIIILLSIFTASMIIGAGCINLQNNSSDIIISHYWFSLRNTQNLINVFLNSMSVNIILMFIVFFSGFSCIGMPLSVITLTIKGLGLGYISGYLFTLSAKGIGYYLINIIPSNIIIVTCLIIITIYSITMSQDITMCISDNKKLPENQIKIYIKKFIIIIVITITACFTDALFCKIYFYLFSF